MGTLVSEEATFLPPVPFVHIKILQESTLSFFLNSRHQLTEVALYGSDSVHQNPTGCSCSGDVLQELDPALTSTGALFQNKRSLILPSLAGRD